MTNLKCDDSKRAQIFVIISRKEIVVWLMANKPTLPYYSILFPHAIQFFQFSYGLCELLFAMTKLLTTVIVTAHFARRIPKFKSEIDFSI